MNDGFLKELLALFAAGFTGQVTLHVQDGCVKMFELKERRQPQSGSVELREVGKGGVSPMKSSRRFSS